MTNISLAVQLYTLRNEQAKDFAGTIKELAKIGYTGVELAGYGNLKSAREVKKALNDANLKVCGGHWIIEQLEAELPRILDENEVLGNKTIVCPWMPEERRQSAEAWRKTAGALTNIGGEC